MSSEPEGVPADYPGRVVNFPDGVNSLVFGMYGVQSPDASIRAQFISELAALCELAEVPVRIERCCFIDSAGIDCDMLVVYDRSHASHHRWWQSDAVQTWWRGITSDPALDTGYWREILNTHKDRFNYAAGVEDQVASAAVLPLKPSKTFGYWGAYRDRLPASKSDPFDSVYKDVPQRPTSDTKGRRLSVPIPDNLCLIREGQGWGNCGPEEKTVWDEQMAAVVDEWVDFLASDPFETGCLAVRKCLETEVLSNAAQPRQCQIAFLLSLGHIEHAARTHITHLAVHKAFVKMYRQPTFDPRMHVWVEVHILKQTDLDNEYVNCHHSTGLLPYFDAIDLD